MKHNAKAFLLIFGISALAIGLAFCVRYLNLQKQANTPPVVVTPRPTPSVPTEPAKPVQSTTVFRSADGVTQVVLPSLPKLPNPFFFYGTSTAFENQMSWNLKDEKGKIIAEGLIYVNSLDTGQPGPFALNGFYDVIPKTASGTLSVFEYSAKDGTPIHVVEIPVELSTTTQSVSVYYSNAKKVPEVTDCQVVFPVKHTVVAGNADLIALHTLLKGPTPWETANGFTTNLPQGVPEPTVRVEGAKRIVDFDPLLQLNVAGSCRVTAIRAQILMTLMQNHPNEEGILSIGGQTEGILQP